uniref:Uncharacterized protein n=1 Tax=Caulobacter sp. (strain K31) TaxID=366602 RepID=B0T0D6_CAUSK
MRSILIGAALALTFAPLAQAGEPPVKTVAKLDAKDPKYDTEACKAVRAKAIDYEEPGLMKKVIGVGGNALVPFAGTAASTAMGMREGSKQTKLSKAVAVACVSDPLNEETPFLAAPKAKPIPVVAAAAAGPSSVVTVDAAPAKTTAVAVDAAATATVAITR